MYFTFRYKYSQGRLFYDRWAPKHFLFVKIYCPLKSDGSTTLATKVKPWELYRTVSEEF